MLLHFQTKLMHVLLVIGRLISVGELLHDLETVPGFTNSFSWGTLFYFL
jgi:hypothetical protein